MRRSLVIRWAVLAAVAGLLIAAALGCGLPGQPAEDGAVSAATKPASPATSAPTNTPLPLPTSTPTATVTPLPAVQGMLGAKASGVGFTGTGNLTVEVSNPGDEPLEIDLPPGFVFLPPEGSGQQRLMVIDGQSITLQPGETATLDPYVVCIDADAHAPEGGADYAPGGLVEDEQLLAFAQCLSEQDIEGPSGGLMPNFGLQFAVWSVSNGYSPTALQDMAENPDQAGANVPQALDPATIQQFEQLGPMFEQMFGGSADYLEACGISTDS